MYCALIYRELNYDLQIRHHLNFISSAKNLILPQLLLSYTLIDVVAEHFVHFLNTVKQVIYIKTLNVYCNLWLKTFPQFKFSWSVEKVEIKAVFAECELQAKQKLVVELQTCKPCLSMFNTLLHYTTTPAKSLCTMPKYGSMQICWWPAAMDSEMPLSGWLIGRARELHPWY